MHLQHSTSYADCMPDVEDLWNVQKRFQGQGRNLQHCCGKNQARMHLKHSTLFADCMPDIAYTILPALLTWAGHSLPENHPRCTISREADSSGHGIGATGVNCEFRGHPWHLKLEAAASRLQNSCLLGLGDNPANPEVSRAHQAAASPPLGVPCSVHAVRISDDSHVLQGLQGQPQFLNHLCTPQAK